MAMSKGVKIALATVGGAIIVTLGCLSVKGCVDNRDQDDQLKKVADRVDDLENRSEINDSILYVNDSILADGLGRLGDRVDSLRHDVDSAWAKLDTCCCDCDKPNKKVKPVKPRKPVVADTSVVEPVNPGQRPNNQPSQPQGSTSITVSNGNAVIVNGNNNNTTVIVPNSGVQVAADTAKAIHAVVRCSWQNVR